MKIAVIGASGNAGARISAELARRGHAVTAIARNPEKIARLANVIPTKGDASDEADLTQLLRGHDAAISSIHFLASDPMKLIGAAKASGGRALPRGRRRRQPRGGPRCPAGHDADLPGPVQGGGREGRGLPRSARAGEGTELDLHLALGPVHRRRAYRQVPARNRPTADRRRRQELDQL